jgi:hypothetical protein
MWGKVQLKAHSIPIPLMSFPVVIWIVQLQAVSIHSQIYDKLNHPNLARILTSIFMSQRLNPRVLHIKKSLEATRIALILGNKRRDIREDFIKSNKITLMLDPTRILSPLKLSFSKKLVHSRKSKGKTQWRWRLLPFMSIRCRTVIQWNCSVRVKANKIYLTIFLTIIQPTRSILNHNNNSRFLPLRDFRGSNRCLKLRKHTAPILETWNRKFDWRSRRRRVCSVDIWVTRKKQVLSILKAFDDIF